MDTTPQRYLNIFLAKFTILIILCVFVFTLLNIGILLQGIIPCLVLDARFPIHTVPYKFFAAETLGCFILSMPIIAFQYVLSLHYKNFMFAIGIGLAVYVGSMPGIKLGAIGYISPYSYVLNYFDEIVRSKDIWIASTYFIFLFVSSYFLYRNKAEKG